MKNLHLPDCGVTKEAVSPVRAKKGNVLAVDDEPGIRDMLSFELANSGYSVSTAGDGESAVAIIKKTGFDVIITDIKMPGMDGLRLLEEARKLDLSTEVIMMTGYGTMEYAITCIKLGAYDFMLKPFSVEEMLTSVERAMERKMLKARVKELSELDRLRSEFVANISHELRTPLNVINGYVSLLMERAYGGLSEQQMQVLRYIEDNSNNLLFIINNVLDFSSFESGRMPLWPEHFELTALLDEAVRMMEPLLRERPDVQMQFKHSGKCFVYTDSSKVKQIAVNLISNAIKFTEKGLVSVILVVHGKELFEIRVKDSGIGMTSEQIKIIFDPYRQVDGSVTRVYGGAGIGLSVVKRFAGLLCGEVSVESVAGAGSEFVVRLPMYIKDLASPKEVYDNDTKQKSVDCR